MRAAAVAAPVLVFGLLMQGGTTRAELPQSTPAQAEVHRVTPAMAPASVFSPDDPSSVQRGISEAVSAGLKTVVIPAGTYRVAGKLRITGAHDLVIDATGVTFVMLDNRGTSITFENCARVELRGLTLLYDQLTFTQGVVEAVDEEGQWLDLRVHRGYPVQYLLEPGPVGYPFDPQTRQWKTGARDCYFASGERLGEDVVRLHWPRPLPKADRPVVGDLMAFRGSKGRDIHLKHCEAMVILDLTIRGGSGFCVHEDHGEGGNHCRFTVTYPDKPAGATEMPLVASNADAFHSSGVRRGPTLEGCHFEGMPDDGIAIHAKYAMVMQAAGSELIINVPWENSFRPGDPLRLIGTTGELKGEAKVVFVRPAEGYSPEAPIEDKFYKDQHNFFELVLDRELPALYNDRVSDPASKGSGFVLRDNVIRNNRAFGIRVRADDGVIENNTVDGSTMAGLTIAPEIYWNSGDYSRNLQIRNNTFRHCAYFNVGRWTLHPGVVNVAADGDQTGGIAYGHQNITFDGNRFEDDDGTNLLIDGAQGVVIKNNIFLRSQRQPSFRGTDKGVDARDLVFLRNCRNVRLEENVIVDRGPAAGAAIGLGKNVESIVGETSGIRVSQDQ